MLALTKIGDLLINDKITETEDKDDCGTIALSIPDYQRPYKWTAKNANQLLDDIIEAKSGNKEVYRVGTLILYKENGKDFIVDGQQRTITFALLLKCLNDSETIKFLEQKMPDNDDNERNILTNYMALKRRIDKMSDSERTSLYNYVCNNCEMIVVITEDISEAFQFFDSQNTRGKKLYPHDLLKAYHLREMRELSGEETEKIVNGWEELNQIALSSLFSEYLYRLKEWVKGNRADELNEQNMDMFKGVASKDNYPYAQFYKGAFSFADNLNNSNVPFVTGIHKLNAFQIDTPIVAGKPFFDYAKHYFAVLSDIQNNDKYEGCFVNDNNIVKTLDLSKYKRGTGNRITRLLFDSAILLYVDRFCPDHPSETDLKLLDQFVLYAFIWAYSMRAQYTNVGWLVAQNYILGRSTKDVVNSFNIYKVISESNSPVLLLSTLADMVMPLPDDKIDKNAKYESEDGKDENYVYEYYLNLFKKYDFWCGK